MLGIDFCFAKAFFLTLMVADFYDSFCFFLLRKSVFLTLMDAVLKRSMLAFGLPTP
jgi:hypothetical protein